jgi:hypothetical protein
MNSSPSASRRALGLIGIAAAAASISATGLTTAAFARTGKYLRDHHKTPPVKVTVFSPGNGDHSGTGGAGFIVDLAVDATSAGQLDPVIGEWLSPILQRPQQYHLPSRTRPGRPGPGRAALDDAR